jgi:lipoprotein-releasing system permease protein
LAESGSKPFKGKSTSRGLIRKGNAFTFLWRSPWTTKVGYRYLRGKKQSRFLSLITLISIAGVALGVTAMIVVLSVMGGFESELRKRLMISDLHVLIHPTSQVSSFEQGYITDSDELRSSIGQIEKTLGRDLLSLWPVISTEAILKSGRKVSGVVVKGVSDERLDRMKGQIVETADPLLLRVPDPQGSGESVRLPGLFVGKELAQEMHLLVGDQATLISPTETEGPMSSVPRMKRFVIEGIYETGIPEQELQVAFARAPSVRSYLRKSGVISSFELTVRDFEQAPRIAREIQKQLPAFRVQDWMQMNGRLFGSLKLERTAMFIILAFIVVVASFNIVTTLTLMVLEKKKEISILRAMGARMGEVAAIFLSEGIFIGVLGVGGGTVSGLALCGVLKRWEFIQLPDIYYDRTLPVLIDPVLIILVAIAATFIVLTACLYPSRRAARIEPIEGIRFG